MGSLINYKFLCPVCQSDANKQIIGEYDYIKSSKYFCPQSRDKNRNKRFANSIKRLWKQDKGFFLRCKNCSFGFGYPYVGGDEEFYKISHEQSQYPLNRWEYDITINSFFKQEPPKKLLDIGAGAGYFLDKFNCSGKYALEGSETTRCILRNKGIKVNTDEKKLIEENRESFNYITMFQVLEHIAGFENMFYTSNQLLTMHSSLIISVPDCDAMIQQEKLTGYPDLLPVHINKWTPDSLNIALEKFGFKLKEIIYEPPSIRKFFDSVYLRIMHKATINGTLASSIYKIKNKKLRIFVLGFYSLIEVPPLLFHYKKLDRAGSFLARAEKVHHLN